MPRSNSAAPKLGPRAQRLLTHIRIGELNARTTEQLAKLYFVGLKKPENYRIVITNLVRELVRKTANTQAPVKRTERSGPIPVSVWIAPPSRRKK